MDAPYVIDKIDFKKPEDYEPGHDFSVQVHARINCPTNGVYSYFMDVLEEYQTTSEGEFVYYILGMGGMALFGITDKNGNSVGASRCGVMNHVFYKDPKSHKYSLTEATLVLTGTDGKTIRGYGGVHVNLLAEYILNHRAEYPSLCFIKMVTQPTLPEEWEEFRYIVTEGDLTCSETPEEVLALDVKVVPDEGGDTMNSFNKKIDNCLDCDNSYTDRILTEDSFEHDEGCYCRLVEDKSTGSSGQNGKHRLVGSSEWTLRDCCGIPDWCPMLTKENGGKGPMNIIITAGPTNERIDSVMKITNMSTGSLGARVAEAILRDPNLEIGTVYYISTKMSRKPEEHPKLKQIIIESTQDLIDALGDISRKTRIDAIVHSAAVGDYKGKYAIRAEDLVDEILSLPLNELTRENLIDLFDNPKSIANNSGKMSSYEPHLMVMLALTPKVIGMMRELFPNATLIGFKLLDGVPREELVKVATKLREKNDADYIIANDLSKIGGGKHWGVVIGKLGEVCECETKEGIAETIKRLISGV